MNQERLLTILRLPHVSEKTSNASMGYTQYAFKVPRNATKPEVKKAVEQYFNVKVRAVNICNVKSKPARFGKTQGRHKAWKKAYIMLGKDQNIDLAG